MDIDWAKERIRLAPDTPPFSDVMLEILDLVARMDDEVARLKQRVQDLERGGGIPRIR